MPARKFDVVVIGGGNAGMGVTGPTRKAGLSGRRARAGNLRRDLLQSRLHPEESPGRRGAHPA